MKLPERFIDRMTRELGPTEAERLCAALQTEPSTSIRLNPEKLSTPKWPSKRVPWCEWGYMLDERPAFTLDPAFHAGAYYVQEASSQFAGYIMMQALGGLAECCGRRILDVCAAPGGKSTHYASLVGSEGLVVANEINRSRAAVLADNARKWGLANMVITCNDSSRLTALEGWFDAVAVDAPCSGEGMFRKSEEAVEQWSDQNVAMCAERQWEILENAFQALRPGGVLIYSTCTFNRSEDEGVLRRASEEWGDQLEPLDEIDCPEEWGVVRGREGAFQTFRFFPHRVQGEGMFMGVAVKAGIDSSRCRLPKSRRQLLTKPDRQSEQELARWVLEPEKMRFYGAGETLYACRREHYEALEAMSGALSVIYSGVAMGQIFKGRLKPDGALAFYVGLNREAVASREVETDVALQFLRRQEVAAEPFKEGLNLVLHDGQALGFVKRVGARVNNMYPSSLRILK